MQRQAKLLVHGPSLTHQLSCIQRQGCAGFASKKDSAADDKPPIDLGSRFASQLSPLQRERMKTILDVPSTTDNTHQGASTGSTSVPYVTISLLQTMKHLNTSEEQKQRLMGYKVMSLNRQLEKLHSESLRMLSSLKASTTHIPSTKPAGQGMALLRQLGKVAKHQT